MDRENQRRKARLISFGSQPTDMTGPPDPEQLFNDKNGRLEERVVLDNESLNEQTTYAIGSEKKAMDDPLHNTDYMTRQESEIQDRTEYRQREADMDIFRQPVESDCIKPIDPFRVRHQAMLEEEPSLKEEPDSEDEQPAQWFSSGSIGGILLDAGKISEEDAERILKLQKDQGLRFGEAAVRLGYVTETDIQLALSRQFDYPYLTVNEHSMSQELVAAYQPFSRQVEALRAMRTQLLLRWFDGDVPNSLAIISTQRGDGRSFLAANLAIVFSQLGEKTLLIDGDLRNPRQHDLFGLSNQSGFSTYLSGRSKIPVIHRIGAFMDLSVMTSGAVPPNPQELLYRPQFGELLSQVARDYNVVIIDTPAATHADAQLMASRAGTSLMVTRKNRSKVQQISAFADSIRAVGGNIVGGIVNEY